MKAILLKDQEKRHFMNYYIYNCLLILIFKFSQLTNPLIE